MTQRFGQNDSAGRAPDSTTLRQRAEEKARAAGHQDLEALSPEEARRLLHELRAYCRERLTGYKVPRQIHFRDSLPKTMVGKVLRRALVAETKAEPQST